MRKGLLHEWQESFNSWNFLPFYFTYMQNLHAETVAADKVGASGCVEEFPDQIPNNGAANFREIQVTEEQRVRMEASRLKALERAAARLRSSQAT